MKGLLITNGSSNGNSSSLNVFLKFIHFFNEEFNHNTYVLRFSPDLRKKKIINNELIFSTILFSGIAVGFFSKIFPNYLFYISKFYSKFYSKDIIKFLNKNKIDRIWVYYDILPVLVLSELLKYKVLNYHLSIFDNPFSVNYNPSIKKKIFPEFEKILLNSSSVDVTTHELFKQICNRYVNFYKPYALSFSGVFKKNQSFPLIRKDVKRICLAGSIFGVDALNNFLSSCSDLLKNKSIQFDIYSSFSKAYIIYIKKKYPALENNLNFFNFLDEKLIVSRLQVYDLLYLPLYFGNEKIEQSMSSFPSKLHNYLASGIPIIFHVPEFSALYNYSKLHNIGFIISSLENKEILDVFLSSLDYNKRILVSKNIIEHNNQMSNNFHLNSLFNHIFNVSKK